MFDLIFERDGKEFVVILHCGNNDRWDGIFYEISLTDLETPDRESLTDDCDVTYRCGSRVYKGRLKKYSSKILKEIRKNSEKEVALPPISVSVKKKPNDFKARKVSAPAGSADPVHTTPDYTPVQRLTLKPKQWDEVTRQVDDYLRSNSILTPILSNLRTLTAAVLQRNASEVQCISAKAAPSSSDTPRTSDASTTTCKDSSSQTYGLDKEVSEQQTSSHDSAPSNQLLVFDHSAPSGSSLNQPIDDSLCPRQLQYRSPIVPWPVRIDVADPNALGSRSSASTHTGAAFLTSDGRAMDPPQAPAPPAAGPRPVMLRRNVGQIGPLSAFRFPGSALPLLSFTDSEVLIPERVLCDLSTHTNSLNQFVSRLALACYSNTDTLQKNWNGKGRDKKPIAAGALSPRRKQAIVQAAHRFYPPADGITAARYVFSVSKAVNACFRSRRFQQRKAAATQS